MVYCTCCKQDVTSKTHRIHLRGGGPQHTKIAREAVNLTSRLLNKFRKRKRGHDESSEEEDGRINVQSPGHSLGENHCGSSPVPDYGQGMDVDDGAASPDPDPEAALPTTRPRVLEVCNDSDNEEDSSPSLVFDDSDLDPELDEELLVRTELTAHELLEGEFVAEEMARGTSYFLNTSTWFLIMIF
ncbi:hypothetical protein K438DRAFT_1771055 [Mycena galopus ATCC 62051]|nr:hypothetical protein K438DRAFT_1771055 [Mycena galopus ATCC 62051]